MNLTNNVLRIAAQINITALPPKAAAAKTGQKKPRTWPAKKVAEAEIVFIDGFLADHTLRGFTIWRKDDDDLFVTGPQRSYKKDGEDCYYQFLIGKNQVVREHVAAFFIAEYHRVREQRYEAAEPHVNDERDDE